MKVTGVNAQVAKAHGYVVRTRADGTQYAAKPGQMTPADNVENGDCGTSWVFVVPNGNLYSHINTGFQLNELSAISYYWHIDRFDNWGHTANSWGGGLSFRTSWQGKWTNIRSHAAGYELAVVSPGSDALLWDGDVCSSLAPSDSEYVF